MSRALNPVTVVLDGRPLQVASGTTVAAALQIAGIRSTRLSVRGEARAPFCGMGICHECRVLIDGRRALACQTLCAEGLRVQTDALATPGEQTP